MIPWIVITIDDVQGCLNAPQVAALRTAAVGVGQTDPFTAVARDISNYVRNRISGRVNVSATAYAVPPELRRQTAYLIAAEMQRRVPQLALTQDQRDAVSRAQKDLDIAGTTDLPISLPPDAVWPSVRSAAGAISVISEQARKLSHRDFQGL